VRRRISLIGTIARRGVQKVRLRNFGGSPIVASVWQYAVPLERRSEMAWKAPKIVEVPVGMEINMYACAARK